MKQLFYLLAFMLTTGIYNHSKAQCTISDLKLKLNSVNTSTCQVNFDLSWTQEINSGNKYAYIHMWTETGYHTPAANWANMYGNSAGYPKAADLVNTLANIVVDDNHADNAFIGSIYHPDPSFILPPQPGLSLVKVHLNNTLVERMTLQNITVNLPSCTGAQTILFDIWASQSSNGKNVHCAIQNTSIVLNNVKATGLIYCTIPPGLQIFLANNGPAITGVDYHVYIDHSPLGIIDPSDSLVFTAGLLSLPANGIYVSPVNVYLSGNATGNLYSKPLIVEATLPGLANSIVATVENSCGPLPVKFAGFTATNANGKVAIQWQTATEQNSRGFEVQRKLPNENFKTIAFVPTLALNGNSSLLLSYRYDDLDNPATAGQVFYRIKQMDIDGKTEYSEIRSVKKDGPKSRLLVYPNPSNGNVQVTMPNIAGLVDIALNDYTGKAIKTWNRMAAGKLQLNNLNSGIYLLNVVVGETGERLMSKIVVK